MSELNIEDLKKKVTDRIIDFWTGESTNPKVDTAKKISDLVNELKEYKWQANGVDTSDSGLHLQRVTKRTFFFDYVAHASTNGDGHLRGVVNTEEIEAWDEEHATLLFKEKHPDTPFDPPY